MTQPQKELLDLRGKIAIEYDWEQEEVLELKAAEVRGRMRLNVAYRVICV